MKPLRFMPHQEEVLDLTERFNRCAYYLDMGLGKTFVGAEKLYLLNNDVNLVICQKSKIGDWIEHFTEYYPAYQIFDLTNRKQAIAFISLSERGEGVQVIGVINYETAFRRNWLKNLHDFTLMLDRKSVV